ncbi:hypothetical protein B9Z55_023945 [Caenorhabditis nigoni]|uniref:Uncharacterized protein n=1 Tax=Caenorhabditis nigoni TaxID=1611254 RepID=A0A2G5SSP7_9PELO|nr:hypothetical protein B9Z55_023945 [Caenorhabditis nigoni]
MRARLSLDSVAHKYCRMATERDGGNCLRVAVSIFSIYYWISALAHVFLGLWMLLDPKRNYILDLVHFSENDPLLKASAYVSLVCGCAQLLVGFLGLCGAVNRSRFLLLMFVMFLICTFLADVAMGTLSLFYKDKFSNNYMEVYLKNLTANRYSRDRWVMPLMDTIQFYIYSLKENVREIVKSKYGVETDEPENRMLTQFIDKLQFYERCCGSLGPSDYIGSRWSQSGAMESEEMELPLFPVSCCTQIMGASALNPLAKSYARCQQFGANRQWRHPVHQCCGGEGPLDYKDSFWYITNTLRGTRSFVPPSCCKQAQAGRAWAPVPIDPMCITYRYLSSPYTTSVNTVGCSDRLMSWFNEQIWIFVGFGFGSALTMMLGISLSCCLISRIHIYHVIREDY